MPEPETARDSQRHLTCCLCVAWDLNPGRMLILLSCDADFSKALAFWNPKNPKTCQTHPLQCHYSNCLILHYRHYRVHWASLYWRQQSPRKSSSTTPHLRKQTHKANTKKCPMDFHGACMLYCYTVQICCKCCFDLWMKPPHIVQICCIKSAASCEYL